MSMPPPRTPSAAGLESGNTSRRQSTTGGTATPVRSAPSGGRSAATLLVGDTQTSVNWMSVQNPAHLSAYEYTTAHNQAQIMGEISNIKEVLIELGNTTRGQGHAKPKIDSAVSEDDTTAIADLMDKHKQTLKDVHAQQTIDEGGKLTDRLGAKLTKQAADFKQRLVDKVDDEDAAVVKLINGLAERGLQKCFADLSKEAAADGKETASTASKDSGAKRGPGRPKKASDTPAAQATGGLGLLKDTVYQGILRDQILQFATDRTLSTRRGRPATQQAQAFKARLKTDFGPQGDQMDVDRADEPAIWPIVEALSAEEMTTLFLDLVKKYGANQQSAVDDGSNTQGVRASASKRDYPDDETEEDNGYAAYQAGGGEMDEAASLALRRRDGSPEKRRK